MRFFTSALCLITGAFAASVSRTRLALRVGTSERWNPFSAAKDAVKARWNPIDKMRGEMCWDRKDMLEHDDCMEWMIDKCKKDTGESKRCQKLRAYVKKHCDAGEEIACDYAKQLGYALPAAAAPAPAPVQAPAPSPVSASPQPAPAPSAAEEGEAPSPALVEAAPAPAAAEEEKVEEKPAPSAEGKPKKLQSQGFEGKKVRHIDGQTYSSDWHDEYEHASTTTKPPPRSGARSSKMSAIAGVFSLTLAACSFY